MSKVIAIRVPKELKEELDELDVDYSEDVRQYLKKIVKQKQLSRALAKASELRKKIGKKTGMTSSSAEIIRQDRDHGH